MGLAYAAIHQDPKRIVSVCLEVEDVETARRVAGHLRLREVVLVTRRGDNAHVRAMEETLSQGAAKGASFVLTGKAGTIQALRRSLRQQSIPAMDLIAKAYWAPGKRGLD
jgi:NADPH-dependent ferric siderophore reductase